MHSTVPFVKPDSGGGTEIRLRTCSRQICELKGPSVESTMCYLRGTILKRIGGADDAKESLMEALAIDCKNVDLFEQHIGGEIMKIDEGIYFSIIQSSSEW